MLMDSWSIHVTKVGLVCIQLLWIYNKTWIKTKLHYNLDHQQPGDQHRRSQTTEEALPKANLITSQTIIKPRSIITKVLRNQLVLCSGSTNTQLHTDFFEQAIVATKLHFCLHMVKKKKSPKSVLTDSAIFSEFGYTLCKI